MPIRAGGTEIQDDVLAALGKVTVTFANLDASLDWFITNYLYPQLADFQASLIVTADMSARQKTKVFGALYRMRLGEDDDDQLKDLLKTLNDVIDKRNLERSTYTTCA